MSETKAYSKVADVMTPSVKLVGRMSSVADAIQIIRENGVSSLVVERRDETDEYGLLTISDIACEVIAKERPAERTSVYEVMSKPVLTVPADMNIKYAVRLLVRFGLSRALVVDDTRSPVGIVTMRDMVLHTPA